MDHEWQFAQAKPHGWIWRRIDKATGSVSQMSDSVFPLLYDCVEDAKQHGFIPSPVRHREPGSPSSSVTLSTDVPTLLPPT